MQNQGGVYLNLKRLKKQDGQAMVEFGLVITLFLIFVFGLISLIWWFTSAFFAQQIAHEAARKYAVTIDKQEAEQLGKDYLKGWANSFIDVSKTTVIVSKKDETTAKATVTVRPRFATITLLGYDINSITRSAQSPFEDFIRHPEKYHKSRW